MATTAVQTSNQFSLNWQDLGKGLLVAVGGAVVTAIENSIAIGSLTFDWKNIGLAALAAGIAYLGKNFFTPSKISVPADIAPSQAAQAIADVQLK